MESLALTIELSLEATHRVIDALNRRARTVGLLMHRLGTRSSCPQDTVPHDLLRRTWRAHLGRRGLDLGHTRLLHQARHGRRSKALTNGQQVTVAEFVNAGLLVRTSSGGTELSDDVRCSLLLDQDAS